MSISPHPTREAWYHAWSLFDGCFLVMQVCKCTGNRMPEHEDAADVDEASNSGASYAQKMNGESRNKLSCASQYC